VEGRTPFKNTGGSLAVKNNAWMMASSVTGTFSGGIARIARAKQKKRVKDTR